MNFDDVLNIAPEAFAEESRNWRAAADGIRRQHDDVAVTVAKLDTWVGPAADAGKPRFAAHRDHYLMAAEAMAKFPPVLEDAAHDLGAVHDRAWTLKRDAAQHGWRITSDGRVVVEGSGVGEAPIAGLEPAAAHIEESARAVIADAGRLDGDIAARLRALSAQAAGFAPPDQETTAAAATAIPAKGTSPADVKAWWSGLTPVQQEALLFTHAAEIGALDGIPATTRDRANRTRLAELTGQLDAERNRQGITAEQRAEIENRLYNLDNIAKRLATAPAGMPEAYLLGIDTSGNGRAIIAIGNPDTAANVGTFVPGTGTGLTDATGGMVRSDRMLKAAMNAGSPSTSVITWIGYDAPQNPVEAAFESYADNAARDLDRFQDGLRATHEGAPSHNTVIGHSYGSTVIGHTASQEGINADELVFVGSPGVGVDRASDLNFPTDHVHATVAEHDAIHGSNIEVYDDWGKPHDIAHGRDPADPRFGGHVFSSAPGTDGPLGMSLEAHSEYWERDNPSLANMGKIIAGRPTT